MTSGIRIVTAITILVFFVSCNDDSNNTKTDHNTAKWEQVSTNLDASLNFLEIKGNTVFAGSSSPGGVYISSDSCRTWSSYDFGFQLPQYLPVHTFHLINNNVFVGTDDGIYHSSDNGVTWIPDTTIAGSSSVILHCYGFASIDNRHFVAMTPTGNTLISLFQSTDGGGSWSVASSTLFVQLLSITSYDSVLLMGTQLSGIIRSTDYGNTWTDVSPASSPYVWAFFIDGQTILAGTTSGILKSTNSGTSWTLFGSGLPNASVHTIISYNARLFAAINGHGIYQSSDAGETWSSFNDGLQVNNDPLLTKTALVIGDYLYTESNGQIWRIALTD